MKEDTARCIANCLATNRGSHVLYRGFGLSVVDEANPPMRRDILIQLSTYYPDATLNNVSIIRAETNGHFEYKIETSEGV